MLKFEVDSLDGLGDVRRFTFTTRPKQEVPAEGGRTGGHKRPEKAAR